jgi:hypothetical protein
MAAHKAEQQGQPYKKSRHQKGMRIYPEQEKRYSL